MEITDIDAATGQSSVTVIENVITAEAAVDDLRLTPEADWIGSPDPGRSFLTPLLYVGSSFGGLALTVQDDALPEYVIPLDAEPRIVDLPLASGSSKIVHGVYGFRWRTEVDGAVPSRRRGTELLTGPLANPLPVTLADGKLFYGNWSYVLPTRLPPGGRIADVDTLRQRNLRALLGRRRSVSGSVAEAYDPSPRESLDRITTLTMFHRAGGGEGYTGLRQFELSTLDLSDSLTTSQCLLVGRLERPLTRTTGFRPSLDAPASTYVRVLLPLKRDSR